MNRIQIEQQLLTKGSEILEHLDVVCSELRFEKLAQGDIIPLSKYYPVTGQISISEEYMDSIFTSITDFSQAYSYAKVRFFHLLFHEAGHASDTYLKTRDMLVFFLLGNEFPKDTPQAADAEAFAFVKGARFIEQIHSQTSFFEDMDLDFEEFLSDFKLEQIRTAHEADRDIYQIYRDEVESPLLVGANAKEEVIEEPPVPCFDYFRAFQQAEQRYSKLTDAELMLERHNKRYQ